MSARAKIAGALGVPAALSIAVIAVALLVSLGSGSLNLLTVTALVNLLLTVGLYIFVGNSGVYSFGHMSFALVGAYAGGLLVMPPALKHQLIPAGPAFLQNLNLSPWAAVLVAGLLATIGAVIVVVPLSRIGGLTAGLATVSLLIAVTVVASQWQSVTRGTKGLSAIPTSTTLPVMFVWAAVAIFCAWSYQRSRFGKRLRASKSDEIAAAAAGVSIPFERGVAFVLSAFFTGIGGALFALQLGSVAPDTFYLDYTFLIITMLVIGGADTLTGAVLGASVVAALQEILRQVEGGSVLGLFEIPSRPGIAQSALGLILVLMLILRPAGLVGDRELNAGVLARFRRRFGRPSTIAGALGSPPTPERPASDPSAGGAAPPAGSPRDDRAVGDQKPAATTISTAERDDQP